jgi:DNA polymerase III epsilon subunit-like protein
MELIAVIEALLALKRRAQSSCTPTRSTCMKGITEWIRGWKARGWRTAAKEPVKNATCGSARRGGRAHEIEWVWVQRPFGAQWQRARRCARQQGLRDAAMRRIVLDTETTGLEPAEGHRIIELAALELHDRRATGRHFHRYVNPERAIDFAATEVHGLTAEDLADKPRFADIADELLDFVQGAELLIHNAPFDVAFLNAELERIGRPRIETVCSVCDTLAMAREMHPARRTRSTRCASATPSTIRSARCTGRSWMRSCSPTSGSR